MYILPVFPSKLCENYFADSPSGDTSQIETTFRRTDFRPLPSSYRSEGGILYLYNVQPEDAGEYACIGRSRETLQILYTIYATVVVVGKNYASPSSRDACSNRQLIPNFELWVEIFCVLTCFHMRIPKPCLSVHLYPEKRIHLNFVHIILTLVIDTSIERFSQDYSLGTKKFVFLKKKTCLP